MPFLANFTAADNTYLNFYTADSGETFYDTSSSTAPIITANRLRFAGSDYAAWLASAATSSADVILDASLYKASATGTSAGIMARGSGTSSSNLNCYLAIYNLTNGNWELYKSVSGSLSQLGSGYAQSLSNGSTYKVRLECIGSAIKVYTDNADSVLVERISITDSSVSGAGKPGVWLYGGDASNGIHIDSVGEQQNLVSGAATFSSATDSTISGSVGAPTGGASPYTYQWYRSTTANFAPGGGNILSGATSTSLADSASLTLGTVYYYKCRTTDNASATVDSNQIAGALLASPLIIGCLGDSITKGTAGPSPASVTVTQRLAAQLQAIYQQRSVTVSNQGVDSKGAVHFAADTDSIFTSARSAFASAGVTHVLIMLGSNDAVAHRTAAQFASDMSTICAALVSDGYTVVLNYPTYIPAGANDGATDEAATEYTRSYLDEIDGLVDGSTILLGDKLAYQYFVDHQSETQSDLTHLTDAGNISLANMWARALDIILYSAALNVQRLMLMGAG